MPVRQKYGIRTSLAKSRWNSQIQLGAKTSLSMAKKPMTLSTFIFFMAAIFIFAYVYSKTVIAQGGIVGGALFFVGYFGLYYSLLSRTPTLDYKLNYIPVFFKYFFSGSRRVDTGFLESGAPLKNLLGIRPQNGVTDDGMIHFADGEVGICLDVVGNASAMIFKDNQTAVLQDARTIYKNLPSGIGLTLITQASTQDVHKQIHSKLNQLHNLQIDSPGLRQIIKRQGRCLRDDVGSNFSMIRQYLLIRGKEDNVLVVAKTLIDSAASSTNNYLKVATVMTNEKKRLGRDGLPLNEPHQVQKLLKSIFDDYQGR